jgi:hypothetical protein
MKISSANRGFNPTFQPVSIYSTTGWDTALFVDLRIVHIGRQRTEVVGLYFSGEKLWSNLFNGERKVK